MDSGSNESEDSPIIPKDAADDNDSNLLVNSETANKDNPRDTRKLSFIPSKGYFTPSSAKNIVN